MKADNLLIVTADQPDHHVRDTLNAWIWATAERSVCVGLCRQEQSAYEDEFSRMLYVPEEPGEPPVARTLRAIGDIVQDGLLFENLIIVSADTLPIRPDADLFFKDRINKPQIGCVGIGAMPVPAAVWNRQRSRMFELGFDASTWDLPPLSLTDDFLMLTAEGAGVVFENNLHTADLHEWEWNLGDLLAYSLQLGGTHIVRWGTAIAPIPPIFACDSTASVVPQFLNGDFSVFAGVSHVSGYSTEAVRAGYRATRGESGAAVSVRRPTAAGPGDARKGYFYE